MPAPKKKPNSSKQGPAQRQPLRFADAQRPQAAPSDAMPSMQSALPAGAPPTPPGAGLIPTQPPPVPHPENIGAQQAIAAANRGAQRKVDISQPRPEIPERVKAKVQCWWADTDNLSQRANALFEFREANKTLFPARFDQTDPNRGRLQQERKVGRDKRRVNISRIYRDTLQTVALTIPDDLDYSHVPVPQAEPPSDPLLPTTNALNPITPTFGKTMTIVSKTLLNEANLIPKAQAWVQDACTYPAAILKFCFRREFSTSYLHQTPPDQDTSDAAARLESLVQQYASKVFDANDARFQQMLDLVKSLQQNSRLTRFFGIDLQLLPLDSFGISEDVADLVNVYDAAFMFQDVLKTGDDLLAEFPYKGEIDETGNSFGIREDELGNCEVWNKDSSSTDPNGAQSRSRSSSLKTMKVPGQSLNKDGKTDPRAQKYLVREVWCKRERTVYTVVRGLNHFLSKRIPQKTSQRWYPFAVLAPNRVPTELYGASDLELKRDIQDRTNRKRTDEEKARWLSLDRGVYNTQIIDGKESVKLGDIPPGQLRGVNFGSTTVKIDDVVKMFSYQLKPEAFDTTKDERDMDMMGALPVQALGQTGVANYAAEVETAVQGAAVAVKLRQTIIRRELEAMLTSIDEILLQEITPEEARLIAGPYAFWPQVYDEQEAAQIMQTAREAAMQTVAPQVMAGVVANASIGMPVDPKQIQSDLERLAAPIWQAAITQQYGSTEIPTRESIYRRLKVKVSVSLSSSLDRQSRIQSFSLLAQAVLGMTQAAQLSGVPFNPRSMFKIGAKMLSENEDFDEMFPGISPLQVALNQQQQAQQGQQTPGGEEKPTDNPNAQGAQAKQGTSSEKSRGATEGGGRPNPAAAAQQ